MHIYIYVYIIYVIYIHIYIPFPHKTLKTEKVIFNFCQDIKAAMSVLLLNSKLVRSGFSQTPLQALELPSGGVSMKAGHPFLASPCLLCDRCVLRSGNTQRMRQAGRVFTLLESMASWGSCVFQQVPTIKCHLEGGTGW